MVKKIVVSGLVILVVLLLGSVFLLFGAVSSPDFEVTYKKSFNVIPMFLWEVFSAKSLNANTVTVFLPTLPQDNKTDFPSYLKRFTRVFINLAHLTGLQVELRGGTAGGSGVTDINKFKPSMLAYIEELSKFAEESKVSQFTVYGEIDNLLFNFPEEITPFSQELLAVARENYRGRVGIGVCCIYDLSRYNFTGYDYMIASIYPISTTLEEYFARDSTALGINANLFNQLNNIGVIKDRSGLEVVYLGEAGIYDTNDTKQPDFETLVVSEEEEAEYYRNLLSYTEDELDGYSFFLSDERMGVKTDLASEVVKDFYATK